MNSTLIWYISRATGVVAMLLFTAVMVLGMATAGRAGGGALPRAGVLRLHRYVSLLATAFITVHIATAILDTYVNIRLIDVFVPFGAGYSPFWVGLAAIVVDLMLAIGITSALRRHLSEFAWRAVHLSAYALWPMAVLHGWGTGGGDASATWMIAIDIACIAAVTVAAIGWRLRARTHPDTAARLEGDLRHARETIGAHS